MTLLIFSQVLSLGIDGWKCDGTDPYVYELVAARGKGGAVSRKDYSYDYYGDFFDYTREKLGDDRLIMSRPVDGWELMRSACVDLHLKECLYLWD